MMYTDEIIHPTAPEAGGAAPSSTRRETHVRRLRTVVRANAAFSGASGVVALAASGGLADWMGIPRWTLIATGAGLVAYALALVLAAGRPTVDSALGYETAAGDAAWVVVAGALALTGAGGISDAGRWLLAASCLPVADFGLAQYVLARRIRRHPGS